MNSDLQKDKQNNPDDIVVDSVDDPIPYVEDR